MAAGGAGAAAGDASHRIFQRQIACDRRADAVRISALGNVRGPLAVFRIEPAVRDKLMATKVETRDGPLSETKK